MTELCVGAVSRLVVEEAAKLGVAQVIASRRQVNASGGYTGMTQADLVKTVRSHSATTKVIRDHGGPYQNGTEIDYWVTELDEDVAAGFDGLHLDVCKLPKYDQHAELLRLAGKYSASGLVTLQVGGERDTQDWNWSLLATALTVSRPTHCVISLGGHAHVDRQAGELISYAEAAHITECYNALGVKSVAHNYDWLPRKQYDGAVDAINIAPEFGVVEMDAWLRVIPGDVRSKLLKSGYDSNRWRRWFPSAEGSRYERARCGLRYIWAEKRRELEDLPWFSTAEAYVRQEVCDAITAS